MRPTSQPHNTLTQAPWTKNNNTQAPTDGSGSGSNEPPRPPATNEDVAHMDVGMRCECQPGEYGGGERDVELMFVLLLLGCECGCAALWTVALLQ